MDSGLVLVTLSNKSTTYIPITWLLLLDQCSEGKIHPFSLEVLKVSYHVNSQNEVGVNQVNTGLTTCLRGHNEISQWN